MGIAYLLPHLLKETTDKFKEKIGLIINKAEFSYEKILADSILFSKYLRTNNLKRQDRVLIQAGNSYVTIISYWAVLLCDAIACIVDHKVDQDTLDYLIQDLEPTFIIGSELVESQSLIYKKYSHLINICHFTNLEDFQLLLKRHRVLFMCSEEHIYLNTEQDLAMIIYTSGSTGNPKGVMLTHRNVIAAINSISSYLEIADSDKILSVLPVHFDYGLYQMLLSFSNGATLILEKNLLNPTSILNLIQKKQVTILPCLPAIVRVLYSCFKRFGGSYDSILKITNTGEMIFENHIFQLESIFPNAEIFSMYGLTECKRCSFVPPAMLHKKMGSIGIPIPNLEMWIEDEHQNRCLPNTEGELIVSGPTVMTGYWKNKDETSNKIQYAENGIKKLKTGDFAIQDEEGFFYFKGRKDSVIKFKGIKFNSHLYSRKISDIESIERSHLFLSKYNVETSELFICLEMEFEEDLSDQLRSKILNLFPREQQPSHIYVTRQFPSLSNGKLNKNQLEKFAEEDFSKREINEYRGTTVSIS